MARPVLTGARALAHRAMSSLVVLLDNSFSMEAGDAARSNFVVAREAAAALLEQLPRGSETAVLGLAGPMPADQMPHRVAAIVDAMIREYPGSGKLNQSRVGA